MLVNSTWRQKDEELDQVHLACWTQLTVVDVHIHGVHVHCVHVHGVNELERLRGLGGVCVCVCVCV